jgi:proteasome lid subunit RPN8/RPN11
MAFRLLTPQKIVEGMIAQALAEQPLECCGLLAGVREEAKTADNATEAVGRVLRRYPLTNNAASPRAFLCNDRSLFEAYRDMRTANLEVLAVYHSHPTSPAIPSRTDLEQNYMGDEVVCVIVSLAASLPVVRAWLLTETEYLEAAWEVIDV